MRSYGRYIIMLLLLLSGMITRAQNPNVLIANRKNLVLLIDLNSSKKDIDTILKRAAITGVDVNALVKGNFTALIKGGWIKVTQQKNIVQFNRPLKELKTNPPADPFEITGGIIKNDNRHGYMDNAVYGVNRYTFASVYELPSGLTRFILPGNLNAKRVFLSGSFNDWSTLKGKMNKTATGWAYDIKLQPGAYMYKFIVNSNWTTDPNNAVYLDDGIGNSNSVYYKYNYTFKLHGFTSAQKIYVTGSFNKWRPDELPMQKKGDGWECPLYLHEGTYAYRFIIDGKPVADPANANNFKDGDGMPGSMLRIGQVTYFRLEGYPNAHSVHLAGSFNNWNPDAISLKKSGNTWMIPLTLPSGNYGYKFIVDGSWMVDPANPVQVVENSQVNSFIAVNPNHTFRLAGNKNAHVVHLAGSFNNWNPDQYLMGHTGDEWSINLYLKPGKQLYKFIVDDNWIIDPGNKQWEQNQYDTGNSVLWME